MNAKNQSASKQKNADAYFAPTVRPLRVGAFPVKRVEIPENARLSVATAEASVCNEGGEARFNRPELILCELYTVSLSYTEYLSLAADNEHI